MKSCVGLHANCSVSEHNLYYLVYKVVKDSTAGVGNKDRISQVLSIREQQMVDAG